MSTFITRDFMRRNKSCANGYRWFSKNFPYGADIQTILLELHATGGTIFADWLITKAGRQPILYREESLNGQNVFCCGSLFVEKDINLTCCLIVGGDVHAEGDINVAGGIIAGGKVTSGGKVNSRYIESANINEPPNDSRARFSALYEREAQMFAAMTEAEREELRKDCR